MGSNGVALGFSLWAEDQQQTQKDTYYIWLSLLDLCKPSPMPPCVQGSMFALGWLQAHSPPASDSRVLGLQVLTILIFLFTQELCLTTVLSPGCHFLPTLRKSFSLLLNSMAH